MTARLDTWMPLYVADYLRDTQHLSTVEHGAYLLLIMHAWSNGGAIPRDDAQLARITRLTLPQWKKIKTVVTEFWSDMGPHGAIYMHGRVMRELDRTSAISEKRRSAGAAGAAKRWQADSKCDGSAIAEPIANASQIYRQSQSQLHPPSEGKRARGAAPSEAEVESIWNEAPARSRQRSGKPQLRKALTAAIGRGHTAEDIRKSLGAYWRSPDASKDGGEYVKGVHRMVEGDRWQDWGASPSPAQPGGDEITDATWIRRLDALRSPQRIWIESSYGPRPGERGCRVPKHLLENAS